MPSQISIPISASLSQSLIALPKLSSHRVTPSSGESGVLIIHRSTNGEVSLLELSHDRETLKNKTIQGFRIEFTNSETARCLSEAALLTGTPSEILNRVVKGLGQATLVARQFKVEPPKVKRLQDNNFSKPSIREDGEQRLFSESQLPRSIEEWSIGTRNKVHTIVRSENNLQIYFKHSVVSHSTGFREDRIEIGDFSNQSAPSYKRQLIGRDKASTDQNTTLVGEAYDEFLGEPILDLLKLYTDHSLCKLALPSANDGAWGRSGKTVFEEIDQQLPRTTSIEKIEIGSIGKRVLCSGAILKWDLDSAQPHLTISVSSESTSPHLIFGVGCRGGIRLEQAQTAISGVLSAYEEYPRSKHLGIVSKLLGDQFALVEASLTQPTLQRLAPLVDGITDEFDHTDFRRVLISANWFDKRELIHDSVSGNQWVAFEDKTNRFNIAFCLWEGGCRAVLIIPPSGVRARISFSSESEPPVPIHVTRNLIRKHLARFHEDPLSLLPKLWKHGNKVESSVPAPVLGLVDKLLHADRLSHSSFFSQHDISSFVKRYWSAKNDSALFHFYPESKYQLMIMLNKAAEIEAYLIGKRISFLGVERLAKVLALPGHGSSVRSLHQSLQIFDARLSLWNQGEGDSFLGRFVGARKLAREVAKIS